MTPTATVVICAHTEERWDDVVAAVGSVRDQECRPDQLVLVIDHNPALFARAQAAFTDATTVVVANEGSNGTSGARNAGVAAAAGEIVAFLDDDATAERRWLGSLLNWYDDPEVLGVGGAADPNWDTERPRWFPIEFDWVVGCSYRGLPTGADTIRNLMGCNMSIRRDVIERAGGFRHDLGRTGNNGFGGEETEFCIRARRLLGGRFVFEPRARIHHRVPRGRTTWRYFAARCRAEGRTKAHLAGCEGRDEALELERAYVRRTLPSGVARGLRDVTRRDTAGLARSLAIVAGASWTATGYLAGSARRARSG